ncbi:hypothetical protein BDB01DRAFT_719779 [Pilobolus umbonatus]|nr:hypothetical protein BDB01DRAFT_719779 [Pilobolus umbonatus]
MDHTAHYARVMRIKPEEEEEEWEAVPVEDGWNQVKRRYSYFRTYLMGLMLLWPS